MKYACYIMQILSLVALLSFVENMKSFSQEMKLNIEQNVCIQTKKAKSQSHLNIAAIFNRQSQGDKETLRFSQVSFVVEGETELKVLNGIVLKDCSVSFFLNKKEELLVSVAINNNFIIERALAEKISPQMIEEPTSEKYAAIALAVNIAKEIPFIGFDKIFDKTKNIHTYKIYNIHDILSIGRLKKSKNIGVPLPLSNRLLYLGSNSNQSFIINCSRENGNIKNNGVEYNRVFMSGILSKKVGFPEIYTITRTRKYHFSPDATEQFKIKIFMGVGKTSVSE